MSINWHQQFKLTRYEGKFPFALFTFLLDLSYLVSSIFFLVSIFQAIRVIGIGYSPSDLGRLVIYIVGPALFLVSTSALYLLVARNLYHVFKSVGDKTPFSAENGKKLRQIAVWSLVYSVYLLIFSLAIFPIMTVQYGSDFAPAYPVYFNTVDGQIVEESFPRDGQNTQPVEVSDPETGFRETFNIDMNSVGISIGNMVFFALVMLAISEVFTQGAKLKEEQDLTV